jgi:hypothetical protein
MRRSIPAAAEGNMTPKLAYTVGYEGADIDAVADATRRAGVLGVGADRVRRP